MNRFETEAAKATTSIPRNLRNATADEIVRYCWSHWGNQKFNSDLGCSVPTDPACVLLKSVSDTFFDPEHWKGPFYARFPMDADGRDATEWVLAAAQWYHAGRPFRTPIGAGSNGYAA